MQVVPLGEALRDMFPTGSEWARRALSNLGGGLTPATEVLRIGVGAVSAGTGDRGFTDTLFVLTPTLLGCAQDGADGSSSWIDLRTVSTLDALEGEAGPLQDVELFLDSGAVVQARWPEGFSSTVVDALLDTVRLEAGAVPEETADDARPPSDPGMAMPLQSAAPVEDAGLAEASMPPEHATSAEGRESTEPFRQRVSAPHEGGDSNPDGPWNLPQMPWPQDLHSVSYLKGHPAHPRKRKGGVLSFGPSGCHLVAKGLSSWEIHIDWPHVRAITIVGPDEIMFTDQLKIDSNGSAVILAIADGTELVLEIRSRRPPSLRSEMAPVMNMLAAPSLG